ncbi:MULTISPECIES: LamG domain-containing protein [Aliiglaciecola]|uniref:LamG domain-containing protein n=1 Tax=Aliiglaciecola TaxID=1406885 RepID=UPI001C095869|nr:MULTISPECIES: LamG domain-containing protein [Aliiglaciecola]MBU2877251.1 LamG domain-containing protein [Aliiglaciecola lipolytica]MDO6712048.1 LamG domain-containing protein [Aliiglaciecola sp. 2_MG-2023]MDO6754385.1 LamG domain-containing protein [Aliiglaciecola sp. 1_MG-2023]
MRLLFPSRIQQLGLTALLTLLLSACGGSAAKVEQNPTPPLVSQPGETYSGPPANTDDVQRYKLNLWDNISSAERCGACHVESGQSPEFVRADDINLAYSATNPLVNLDEPETSTLVTKVAGGHNCWLASPSACADIMTTWIANWADNDVSANKIQLEAPAQKSPGANKNFPEDSALFAATVHPLLETYCASCHTNSATIPISPYFASSDIDEAYQASKARISLDTPESSRFVGRLRDEFHNCWSNCSSDASELSAAIQAMADGIDITELAPELVNSQALTLFEGTLATGGGRFENDLIAKWEFKTGTGTTAFDTSGVEPAIDLTLSGDVSWIGGWGLQMVNGKAQGSTASSKKLHTLLTATGEMSIEAWVVPANVTQEGPARIISYSGGSQTRNFTLGQTLYNYDYLLRTSNTDANGETALSTADADELLQSSLQHVVITYDQINGRQIYVNGMHSGVTDNVEVGNFNEWNDTYAFVLGNEVSSDIPWAGSIRMVAVHNRTLTSEQIAQNFAAGIGQKFFLLFNVTQHTGIAQSYVVLEVSQFDSYSYLFAEPFFISLDDNATISTVPIQGMRIGINGREATTGQVFQNLDVTITDGDYITGEGQALSSLGTTVAIEKSPEADEFFLTFEQLGSATNVVIEADPPAAALPADLEPQSDIGVRNFAEINASMSVVTGVPTSNAAVKASFEKLKQQLPSVTNIDSYLASNQMAVTQMAIKYCDQLVENSSLRASYFSGFDFTQPANTAFIEQDRNLILTPLLDKTIGNNIATQPQRDEVSNELNNLIDTLSDCSGDKVCNATYTQTIVKATCAATIGSAAILIQ